MRAASRTLQERPGGRRGGSGAVKTRVEGWTDFTQSHKTRARQLDLIGYQRVLGEAADHELLMRFARAVPDQASSGDAYGDAHRWAGHWSAGGVRRERTHRALIPRAKDPGGA